MNNSGVQEIYYSEMKHTPIGPLTLFATGAGLCQVEFGAAAASCSRLGRWFADHFGGAALRESELQLDEFRRQLEAYFAGELVEFSLPLDMRGTDFQLRVWEALLDIPYGDTVSYKDIAVRIGNPKAVRAVGGANNRNPVPVIVPCHRVIGAGGQMVGYGGGLGIKETLLQLEAVRGGALLF